MTQRRRSTRLPGGRFEPGAVALAAAALLSMLAAVPCLADIGDHSTQDHHFVRITDGALTPGVVTMTSGDAIA